VIRKMTQRGLGDQAEEALDRMFQGLVGGIEDGIGLAVLCFAAVKDAAKVAHGLAALRHGAAITLFDDAGHVVFGFGAEPDREAGAEQAIVVAGIGDDAAAGGENEAAVAFEDAVECDALEATIASLTVEIENDGQREAGVALDLAVEFDERALQFLGEQRPQSGFSGSAQAGKRDAGAPQRGGRAAEFLEEQLVRVIEISRRQFFQEGGGLLKRGRSGRVFRGEHFHGDIERASEFAQASDRDVGAAEFDLGQKARGQSASLGELFLSEAAAGASGAEAFSELLEVFGPGFVDRRSRGRAKAARAGTLFLLAG
jgi:hypothetical protein